MRGLGLQRPIASLVEGDRARQGIGGGRRASSFADGAAAHNILLDHNVSRPANDQEMLNIVATDQDQPPPSVNRSGVNHSKPGLAPTRSRGPKVRAAEAPCQPCE
jgi:hypothetical protein